MDLNIWGLGKPRIGKGNQPRHHLEASWQYYCLWNRSHSWWFLCMNTPARLFLLLWVMNALRRPTASVLIYPCNRSGRELDCSFVSIHFLSYQLLSLEISECHYLNSSRETTLYNLALIPLQYGTKWCWERKKNAKEYIH